MFECKGLRSDGVMPMVLNIVLGITLLFSGCAAVCFDVSESRHASESCVTVPNANDGVFSFAASSERVTPWDESQYGLTWSVLDRADRIGLHRGDRLSSVEEVRIDLGRIGYSRVRGRARVLLPRTPATLTYDDLNVILREFPEIYIVVVLEESCTLEAFIEAFENASKLVRTRVIGAELTSRFVKNVAGDWDSLHRLAESGFPLDYLRLGPNWCAGPSAPAEQGPRERPVLKALIIDEPDSIDPEAFHAIFDCTKLEVLSLGAQTEPALTSNLGMVFRMRWVRGCVRYHRLHTFRVSAFPLLFDVGADRSAIEPNDDSYYDAVLHVVDLLPIENVCIHNASSVNRSEENLRLLTHVKSRTGLKLLKCDLSTVSSLSYAPMMFAKNMSTLEVIDLKWFDLVFLDSTRAVEEIQSGSDPIERCERVKNTSVLNELTGTLFAGFARTLAMSSSLRRCYLDGIQFSTKDDSANDIVHSTVLLHAALSNRHVEDIYLGNVRPVRTLAVELDRWPFSNPNGGSSLKRLSLDGEIAEERMLARWNDYPIYQKISTSLRNSVQSGTLQELNVSTGRLLCRLLSSVEAEVRERNKAGLGWLACHAAKRPYMRAFISYTLLDEFKEVCPEGFRAMQSVGVSIASIDTGKASGKENPESVDFLRRLLATFEGASEIFLELGSNSDGQRVGVEFLLEAARHSQEVTSSTALVVGNFVAKADLARLNELTPGIQWR